ncbi:serine hydrolase [Steroidobacter sp.]|uniref:serine hydrolase n=1 Tax=Steroidobacter sp. TaxID=1978227 RepID=UPI001A4CB276|nr:serine hydrolase [Steroidobacter sp.]MBL8269808.1 serine hydrolase [Steroidobacter sp.]
MNLILNASKRCRVLPWLSAFALLVHADAYPAQQTNPLKGFDRYIEQARGEFGNVGLAVAVVHDDRVVFAQGFGLRQSGQPARIGPDTLFQVGSTTKALACASLGVLVDDGKLRWDDPVVDYLPDFQLRDPWLTRQLTVRDTVTHRSGIVGAPYLVMSVMSADDVIRQLRYAKPDGAFRDSFQYSNPMYGVAGKVAGAVSGMSWNEFVRRRLLQPLQMNRSGTSPYEFWDPKFVTSPFQGSAPASRPSYTDARDADVAMPHVMDDRGQPHVVAWQSYDNAAAAGSIVSSAREMANWVIVNLNEGRFAGKQVLSKQTLQALHSVQNLRLEEPFPFQAASEGYAMGWNKVRYRDRSLLHHGGDLIGFNAYVALMPEERIGVVVLSNSQQTVGGDNQAFRKAIALRAVDQLLNGPSRHWDQEFLALAKQADATAKTKELKLQSSRLPNAPPSLPLDRYAGDYEDSIQHSGRVSVSIEAGQLSLTFPGAGAFSAVLEHWHGDVFRLRKKGPGKQSLTGHFMSFVIDPQGAVTSMSLFNETFERLP